MMKLKIASTKCNIFSFMAVAKIHEDKEMESVQYITDTLIWL